MTEDKRILIVDDDPSVLLILQATLERLGNRYTVEAAGDSREALKKVEDQPFDLVISDVRMPGIDGIKLVEMIRALNAETAIIWITAYGCQKLKDEHERLNVYSCLEKPLRIKEIRQAALQALNSNPNPKDK